MKKIIYVLIASLVVMSTLYYLMNEFNNHASYRFAKKVVILNEDSTNNYSSYYTYSKATRNQLSFEIDELGLRQNPSPEQIVTTENISSNSVKVAVFGSFLFSSLKSNNYNHLAAHLNYISKDIKFKNRILFYDYTVPGNNLKQSISLINNAIAANQFDAIVLYLEPRDHILKDHFLSKFNNLEFDTVLTNDNYNQVISLLKDLKLTLAPNLNVDLIPVLLWPHQNYHNDYLKIFELYQYFGFQPCKVELEKLYPEKSIILDRNLNDQELQSLAVKSLYCLLERGLITD